MRPNLVLLFVYSIDRSSLSAVTDYHSSGAARTPGCPLYSLLITPVGMKKGWKRFLNDLNIPSRFLYRDEFQQEFKVPDPLVPAVFIQAGKSIGLLISDDEINRISHIDQLADLVKQRLAHYVL